MQKNEPLEDRHPDGPIELTMKNLLTLDYEHSVSITDKDIIVIHQTHPVIGEIAFPAKSADQMIALIHRCAVHNAEYAKRQSEKEP